MPYRGGGYTRNGVLYQGPTKLRGRRPISARLVPSNMGVKPLIKAANQQNVKTISKVVKKVMSKDEEVKIASNTELANNVLVYGSGLSYQSGGPNQGWVSTVSGLIPSVALGNTQNTRIGNKITPKRLNVRYSIYANPSTDSTTGAGLGGNINPFINLPFRVKVIVFRHRYATDDFSQSGIVQSGATSADLTASVDSFFRPYNRDEYIIAYSKMFKMQPPRHAMTSSYTGQAQDPYARSMVFKSLSLKLPKLRYNDAATVPSNANWYMAVAVCNEDGTTITAGTQSRCTINVESHLYYTDD